MGKLPVPPFVVAALVLAIGGIGMFMAGRASTQAVPVTTPIATPNPLYEADAKRGAQEFQGFVDRAKTQAELDSIWIQYSIALSVASKERPERLATMEHYIKPIREASDRKRATLPPK